MDESGKMKFIRELRQVTDHFFLKIDLPRVNPNIVSGLSVVASLLFLLTLKYSSLAAFSFIVLALLFDWFDGLIAKKYNLCSEKGYMVDVTCDRVSEGIMFIPFFIPWFFLFALNNVLTLGSFTNNKHIILPLRQVFAVYFFFIYVL